MAISRRSGWGFPPHSPIACYFRNGHSLCGASHGTPRRLRPDDGTHCLDDCGLCYRALARERASNLHVELAPAIARAEVATAALALRAERYGDLDPFATNELQAATEAIGQILARHGIPATPEADTGASNA